MNCTRCLGHGTHGLQNWNGYEYERTEVTCAACGGDGKHTCQWEGCEAKSTTWVQILIDEARFCDEHAEMMQREHGAVLLEQPA